MCLLKAGEPFYKPADWFLNWRPIYKPVRFFNQFATYILYNCLFEEILVSDLLF